MATVADIVTQAKAAATEYDGPIKTAAAVPKPSDELVQSMLNMGKKQSDILGAAQAEILASPALDAALATLKSETTNLNNTAKVMIDATAIIRNVAAFLGYGTNVVSTIKSVSKT